MKLDYLSSSPLVVHDPKAARFVADTRASRFLEPFIGRERTASAVASELGVKVSSMLYRIRQLLDLELLHVSRVEPRQGRALKYYRAVADGFFVPFALTDAETLGALGSSSATQSKQLLERSLSAGQEALAHIFEGWGVRVVRDGEGRLDRSLVTEARSHESFDVAKLPLDERVPAIWDQHCLLALTKGEAKALQRELSEVYKRHYHPYSADRQPYIVRLAIAPLKRT